MIKVLLFRVNLRVHPAYFQHIRNLSHTNVTSTAKIKIIWKYDDEGFYIMKTFHDNGITQSEFRYYPNGNTMSYIIYWKNGKHQHISNYAPDGTIVSEHNWDETGQVIK